MAIVSCSQDGSSWGSGPKVPQIFTAEAEEDRSFAGSVSEGRPVSSEVRKYSTYINQSQNDVSMLIFEGRSNTGL